MCGSTSAPKDLGASTIEMDLIKKKHLVLTYLCYVTQAVSAVSAGLAI